MVEDLNSSFCENSKIKKSGKGFIQGGGVTRDQIRIQ